MRLCAKAALGYTVIVVTRQEVSGVEALEKKALKIATAQGLVDLTSR